jgi:alkanesulfonate monooxygenase SsuD/methylene tetrahydromethanopterin reductase-like flavin-dependent oxidoreductase (luciferase family)
MPVEFGLALIESHPKAPLGQWMADLDAIVPQLEGHFKSLWMTDHLFWEDLFAYEVWTTLSFIAARFPKFDIGPMVLGQSYRNPGLLAKMAATLQVFSEGRFIMGLGAGWKADEYRAYNWELPPASVRLEQLEDTIEICKRLWTQAGKVTYQGKHYQVVDAYCEPKPVPIPPIVIGVRRDKALGIAAKYADWWNVSDAPIAEFKDRLAVLDRHCEAIGRDPQTLRRTWFGRVVTGRNQADIDRRANSRLKPYSRDNSFLGTPAQVVEQMLEFVAVGADYFMIDILDLANPDVMGMLLEEIVPKVKRAGE